MMSGFKIGAGVERASLSEDDAIALQMALMSHIEGFLKEHAGQYNWFTVIEVPAAKQADALAKG